MNQISSDTHPTRVRYMVVFSAMLMAVLLYLDRFCVSFALPYIQQSLNLTNFEVGLFVSAFFLPYALAQVPAGFLSDRYGSRIMLTTYIVAWSIFTALMGLAGGFVMLIAMRVATGLGQAGAYPTSSSIISKWVPFSGRGGASSIVAFGGRLGGVIAPLLTALLIVAFVPVENPSTISPNEILDLPALCNSFYTEPSEGDDQGKTLPPELQHVAGQLDESALQRIKALGAGFAPQLKRRSELLKEATVLQKRWSLGAALEKTEQAESVEFQIDDADRQMVADQLNKLIAKTDFYQEEAFLSLAKLDRAAIGFMKRANAGEELSSEESARFNRLLLEGVFPSGIGKVYVGGWRPVMITYGLVGFGVAAFFWFAVRNRPEDHARCNQAERDLIATNQDGSAKPQGAPEGVPWKHLLRSRSLWLSSMAQVGTNVGWIFIVTMFAKYLLDTHQVPILERGLMVATPLFVGWAGMLSGGRVTDFLARKLGVKWGRRLPWSFSRFIAMGAYLACLKLDDPWHITYAMAVVAFSTDLGTSSAWAFTQDVGGKHVGSVLGWGNMWGNLGATVAPIIVGLVMNPDDSTALFMLGAGGFAFAGTMALGIDASKPVVPEDEA